MDTIKPPFILHLNAIADGTSSPDYLSDGCGAGGSGLMIILRLSARKWQTIAASFVLFNRDFCLECLVA